MNTYAARVMSHYQQFLPDQYATIPDPEAYFSTLGEEIETQVSDLTARLAGPDQLGEGYLEKVGRLTAAKMQAEEIVRAEMLTPQPEDLEEDPDEDEEPSTTSIVLEHLKETNQMRIEMNEEMNRLEMEHDR